MTKAPADPEFSTLEKLPARPTRHSRWRWWLFVLLALSGLHLLGTGSPIPLVHIERLQHPVSVRAVASDALILADGRRVRLPWISKLPTNDAGFLRALKHGVEVGADGQVYGLIDPARTCGNDPVMFYRKRANVSELAGLLDPNSIDTSVVPPARVQYLKDCTNPNPRHNGLPYDVTRQLRKVRLVYEDCITAAP